MQSRGRRLFKPNAKDADEKGYLYGVDENGEIIDSVGAELRQARLDAGFEVQKVSNSLRIRRAHLEALEEGRYADLPGAPYAVGFVRSYAKFLGLDSDVVVTRFKGETDNIDQRPKLNFPAPADEGRMPKTWLIVVALVLAGIAYGGWQYFSNRVDSDARRTADVPEELASLASETLDADAPDISPALADEPTVNSGLEQGTSLEAAEAAMSAESSSFAVTVEELPPPEVPANEPAIDAVAASPVEMEAPAGEEWTQDEVAVPASPETVALSPEAVDATAVTPAPAEAAPEQPVVETSGAEAGITTPESSMAAGDNLWEPTPSDDALARDEEGGAAASGETDLSSIKPAAPAHETRVYGGENADARVVIRASGDSWLQVQGPDNELLLTRILHEGDSYRVPNRPGIVMTTGNAGALEIWLDDELLPPMGPPGLVLRDIVLEPEALRAAVTGE